MALMKYTREQLKPVAEAIANQRLMRNGSPPFANPLDFIASKPNLVDEVYEDADAAVEAWEKSRTGADSSTVIPQGESEPGKETVVPKEEPASPPHHGGPVEVGEEE